MELAVLHRPLGLLICLRFAPTRIALVAAYFVVAGETKSVFHPLLLSTAARSAFCLRFASTWIALYPAYFVVAGETKSVFHPLLLSTAARDPA